MTIMQIRVYTGMLSDSCKEYFLFSHYNFVHTYCSPSDCDPCPDGHYEFFSCVKDPAQNKLCDGTIA